MNYKRLKIACYATSVSTSVVCNLSPLLFLIFHNLYNVSYTLLGLLILINFCTQLAVDLLFSFFTEKFDMEKSIKLAPILVAVGLIVYACVPTFLSNYTYLGLVLGTIIFSSAGGLTEVLLSPVIASIPAENPDKEMSKLHSVYAWGVFGIIIFGTVFLKIFGDYSWTILVLVFALIPVTAVCLFHSVKIPFPKQEKKQSSLNTLKNKWVWLCVLSIFFGGASECIMAQWCSSYVEGALGISKVWGDVFGVALFSLALGLGRTLHSKLGTDVNKVLIFGSIGAFICYVVVAIVDVPVIGLISCVVTGFFVSMLWPGSLIMATSKFPSGGVVIFALMASGGDLGASVGPQLVGIITDFAIGNQTLINLANTLSMSPDTLGLKLGMLFGALFPLIAIVLFSITRKIKGEKD